MLISWWSRLQSIHARYLSSCTARKNAIREQKLQMELSAAKKERDFYLSKVERSRALKEIEKRMKKVIGLCLVFVCHCSQ